MRLVTRQPRSHATTFLLAEGEVIRCVVKILTISNPDLRAIYI